MFIIDSCWPGNLIHQLFLSLTIGNCCCHDFKTPKHVLNTQQMFPQYFVAIMAEPFTDEIFNLVILTRD